MKSKLGLIFFPAFDSLLAVPDNDANIGHSSADTDNVSGRPGNMEADLRVGDVGHCDEGVPGSGDQGIEDEQPPGNAIIAHNEGVDLLPSNIELSGMETGLFNVMHRQRTPRQQSGRGVQGS